MLLLSKLISSYLRKCFVSKKAQGMTEYALLLSVVIIFAAYLTDPYILGRYRLIFLQIANSIKRLSIL